MRVLSLALLLSVAAAASAHAQDRYSARGIVVVRDAPPAPGYAATPSGVHAAPAAAAQQAGPSEASAVAPHPTPAALHYLSWPGKGQARAAMTPTPVAIQATPVVAAVPVPSGRFTASAPAASPRLAPAAAYATPAVVYAAPAPRPVIQQSIYDTAPAPAPRAYAAPAPAPAAMRSAYPPATPMTYTRTAPPRMPDAAPVEVASAEPAAKGLRTKAMKAPAVVVDQGPAHAPAAKAPPRDDTRTVKSAARGDVLIPVATAKAALSAHSAAGQASGTAPERIAVASAQPTSAYAARNGGTSARFYSVGRQFGETPDPIVMPKQFFLDGSPDMAAPPPLPIPRIAPVAGKSNAVQRAAAEDSQADPDAPVN